MTQPIKRIYVEKKKPFDIEAQTLHEELTQDLGIQNLKSVRFLNRYDIQGITDAEYTAARSTIFSEPPVDRVYDEALPVQKNEAVIAVEYLPGQYDQRADSAAQCIQIITRKQKPLIVAARLVLLQFNGPASEHDLSKIKTYLINPVDSREASLEKPETLDMEFPAPPNVERLENFIHFSEAELEQFRQSRQLAMSLKDLIFCQHYFNQDEQRDPTITEIKMLDTYWSDHCRHTTFRTRIRDIEIENGLLTEPIRNALKKFRAAYGTYGTDANPTDLCLMDIALMSMKEMKAKGLLDDLEESGEVNACSIIRDVEIDGKTEEWLIMFKNETHNHPTEIEPFGGAATCLGGAIRDPLSGRAFVYHAMRVTGSGNPLRSIEETLPGKLPQRKITTGAAHGYSSYGNQIGVPTGQVSEIYHEGYVAKRMEVGAVIGAVPRRNVLREEPVPGDVVLLVGGRTGRDGIGGATGSSKEHNEQSIVTANAEVQKGNPPEERKLQRLYRNPDACRLIKKSNDFGAGGVSVAIGELADGLEIFLDRVPKKYEGLDGTELAISESQERMAVVVAPGDVAKFSALADSENLEATEIARVSGDKRLKIYWRKQPIVDMSRAFIDTHGVRQDTRVDVSHPAEEKNIFDHPAPAARTALDANDLDAAWLANLKDLNVCSQRGLGERFDGTIGAGTVSMPFGGMYQHTPVEAMAAKVPVLSGETTTATLMSYGFNPEISSWSPFHGAVYAVVEAVAKITASGGDYRRIRTSLQEYFEKPGSDPKRWGKPFGALLGAYHALTELGIAAIGGKDSMSGTFKDIDVPPTLIAFAVDTTDVRQVLTPEFKKTGSPVVYVKLERDGYELPSFEGIRDSFARITDMIREGKVLSAQTVRQGGVAAALSKMAFGNKIGFRFAAPEVPRTLFTPEYGSFLLEMAESQDIETLFSGMNARILGDTQAAFAVQVNERSIDLNRALTAWQEPLESVFPTRTVETAPRPQATFFRHRNVDRPLVKIARPRVLITVFPGSNCEYESQTAFENAGAVVETLVFRNLHPQAIDESLEALTRRISNSQIILIPGGFSAGDEPDGSGKFIAAVFRNPQVKDAVTELLNRRDGLMLGICNGFQALIKLGLVPYGEIRPMDEKSPTLTFNHIGRHVSRMVRTQMVSALSPWLMHHEPGSIHLIPSSHGEGRFVASEETIHQLGLKGQIATQYVDIDGDPTMDAAFNPNGSMHAVEGITSPDGRVLGKMAHTERISSYVAKNVPGDKHQRLFESGVDYFR
ncbi:MAG: phosphoribosylformylglycinamidine synthase [Candidatus Omnitrophota bacterium]